MLHEEVAEAVEELLHFVARDLVEQRDKEYPNEAVGLISADGNVYPLINQARSHKRFEVSQTLVKEGIQAMINQGHDPVATYHSHPTSASGASQRDAMMMQENPGSLHVIVGQDGIAAWLWDGELRSVARVPLPEKVKHGEHR